MTVLGLYVDDRSEDRSDFKYAFERACDGIDGIPPIRLDCVQTREEFREALADGAARYAFVLIDILFVERAGGAAGQAEKEVSDGLLLIHEVNNGYPDLAILAITIDLSLWEAEAKQNGAQEVISKQYIKVRPVDAQEDIRTKVLSALAAKGRDPRVSGAPQVEWNRRDLGLSATMDAVGEKTVAALAARLAEHPVTSVTIDSVAGGMSEATVLKATCAGESSEKFRVTSAVIVKLARDRQVVLTEYEKRHRTGEVAPQLWAATIEKGVVTVGRVHAIGARFVGAATTLRSWAISEDAAAVERTFAQLFDEQALGGVPARSRRDGDVLCVNAIMAVLARGRRARVMESIERYSRPFERHRCDQENQLSVLKTFLEHGRASERDVGGTPIGSVMVHAHGDLHGGNVLVNQHGRPFLIDAASIDVLHWALDAARLVVDLMLWRLAAHAEAFEWDAYATHYKAAMAELFGDGSGASNGSLAVWLAGKRESVFGEVWCEWEWHAALMAELLRGCYRVAVPDTLRVLCLELACVALRRSVMAMPAE